VVEARAIWFGAMIGAAYGEAFFSPGSVPQDGFPGLADLSQPGSPPFYKLF
jgi:hypothetical protein